MYKRYIVVVDLDDVLNNLMDVTVKRFDERTSAPFDWSRIKGYNLSQYMTKEELDIIYSIWDDKDILNELMPQPKSQIALKSIQSQGCDIYIATATNLTNAHEKHKWVMRCYPFISPNNFIIINDKTLLKCDFIIDDKIEMLQECSPWTYRICVDKQWNRKGDGFDSSHNIHRVNNLMEASSFIKQIIEDEENEQ